MAAIKSPNPVIEVESSVTRPVTNKRIWVTTKFAALHCWPNAPKSVHYLRHPHRHMFGVKVTVSVTHSDRDVEFHTLLQSVNMAIHSEIRLSLSKNNSQSCEMIAEAIGLALQKIKYSVVSVSVDEDGENGGEVWFV